MTEFGHWKKGRTKDGSRDIINWRCKKCAYEAHARSKRATKAMLIEVAGGACVLCGYNRCPAALEFHHLDPRLKMMNISGRASKARLLAEIEKCALLCATCHREVEAGYVSL